MSTRKSSSEHEIDGVCMSDPAVEIEEQNGKQRVEGFSSTQICSPVGDKDGNTKRWTEMAVILSHLLLPQTLESFASTRFLPYLESRHLNKPFTKPGHSTSILPLL